MSKEINNKTTKELVKEPAKGPAKEPVSSWSYDNTMLQAKTKVRIILPENTKEQRLMENFQISAPGGLTIEFKLPFPIAKQALMKLVDPIKLMGGTVEIKE